MHSPHQKVEGLVLSVLLIMESLGIQPTDKLNMAQKGSSVQHQNGYGATKDNNTMALFNTTLNQWGFLEWAQGRATQVLI